MQNGRSVRHNGSRRTNDHASDESSLRLAVGSQNSSLGNENEYNHTAPTKVPVNASSLPGASYGDPGLPDSLLVSRMGSVRQDFTSAQTLNYPIGIFDSV